MNELILRNQGLNKWIRVVFGQNKPKLNSYMRGSQGIFGKNISGL